MFVESSVLASFCTNGGKTPSLVDSENADSGLRQPCKVRKNFDGVFGWRSRLSMLLYVQQKT